MFKNATLYRLTGGQFITATLAAITAGAAVFAPTGPTQVKSIGWVPPREKNGLLAESIAGHTIMAAMIETRTVPASAIDKWMDAAVDAIERETGRKPGKKERRELKDNALLELLPQAFPKAVRVLVWIDPAAGLVVLDTASTSQADDVATLIAQSLGLSLAPVVTTQSPSFVLGSWLADDDAEFGGFAVGQECALKSDDEAATMVTYANAALDTDEVRAHVRGGKRVTKLGVYWLDRIDCVLTDKLVLKKIDINAPPGGDAADAFDADVAIFTGELAPMLVDLIEVMGGEPVDEGAS